MATSSLLGKMRVEIIGDNTKLANSIVDSEKKATSLSKTLKTVFAGVVTTLAVRAIAKVGKELIDTASDAQETRNKFKVVFASVADEAQAAAERIREEFKLSESATENFLSGVGDIVTGLGATGEEALLVSEKITSLSLDIDSFANLTGGASQAVSALTSLFTGEREAAKALGIVINDNNLKQFAEDSGLVFKELTPLEKGFLSLELATSQSQLAIGDFARSMDSFANRQKAAKEAVKDLQVEIGKRLLPVATESIELFGKLTGALADFIAERNRLREAEEAEDKGIANTDQRILLLQKETKELERQIAIKKSGFEDNEFAQEADIALVEKQIALLQKQIDANQILQQRLENADSVREQIAKDEAKREADRIAAFDRAAAASALALKAEQDAADARLHNILLDEEALAGREKRLQEFAELDEQFRIEEAERVARLVEENEKQYQIDLDNWKDLQAEKIQLGLQFANSSLGVLSAIDSLSIALSASELQRLEESGASQEELDNKKKEIAIDEAKRKKALGVLNVGIDTASAIIGFLANPGGIPGVLLSAFAGITGAVQLGAIAATPLPSFAAGGIVPGNNFIGDRVPTLQNSGEMNINRADQKSLMDFIQGGSRGNSGNTTVIAQIDKKVLFKIFLDGSKSGQAQFDSRGVINQ